MPALLLHGPAVAPDLADTGLLHDTGPRCVAAMFGPIADGRTLPRPPRCFGPIAKLAMPPPDERVALHVRSRDGIDMLRRAMRIRSLVDAVASPQGTPP